MTMMSILSQSHGGALYADAGKVAGLPAAETERVMAALCPVIALKLKARSAADPEMFETLLDLLEDGSASEVLLTDAEAVADGNAILADLYGSREAAIAELRKLTGAADISKLAPISATSVLAALAKSQAPMPLAGAQQAASRGGGIISSFISALISGLVAAGIRQLTTRRRASYTTTRRKPRAASRKRRATRSTSLEDIFSGILKPKN